MAQPAVDEDMRRFSEVEAVNASRAEGDVTVEEDTKKGEVDADSTTDVFGEDQSDSADPQSPISPGAGEYSLVVPQNTVRPVSGSSRVTFPQQPVTEGDVETHEPPSARSRREMKPKSILVPRMQPPQSVGLTIVQFNSGRDSRLLQRASHKPHSAPARTRNPQRLTKSASWSFDPEELQRAPASSSFISLTSHVGATTPAAVASAQSRATSAGGSGEGAVRPRHFARTFSRAVSATHPSADGDCGLSVEGVKGRATSAGVHARSAGVTPARARSATHRAMLRRQEKMLKRAPVPPLRSAPSIPSTSELKDRLTDGSGPFSFEHESHARKEMSPRRYMERGWCEKLLK